MYDDRRFLFGGFLHGQATTLIVMGLPLVLLGRHLPERIQQAAEVKIGLIIVVLAVRLLVRWRRGVFHAHPPAYEIGERHRHLYSHADGAPYPTRRGRVRVGAVLSEVFCTVQANALQSGRKERRIVFLAGPSTKSADSRPDLNRFLLSPLPPPLPTLL